MLLRPSRANQTPPLAHEAVRDVGEFMLAPEAYVQ